MTETLLLTIPQVATQLGVHRATVYDYIADGDIEVIDIARTGSRQTRLRVPLDALRAYIASRPSVVQPTPKENR